MLLVFDLGFMVVVLKETYVRVRVKDEVELYVRFMVSVW